jgi:D-alanine-D-alanine ligase
MKKALVIFGGASPEYEVSLRSAHSVIDNIPKDKYEVLTLGITKDGRWLLYTGSSENIGSGAWLKFERFLCPAVVSPDRSIHGITVMRGGQVENVRVDVVFPVLHGKNGEDGTIQGLFELAGIPFVGCGTLSSAMSMDKAVTNTLADYAGIAQAKWLSVTSYDYKNAPEKFRQSCLEKTGFPLFVKPANAGSSVGITKVRDEGGLAAAIEAAFLHDDKIVVEENIDGREVECAVLGNDETYAPVVGEIVPCNEFYDYDAKYISDGSVIHIPADIPPETAEKVRAEAQRIYRTLGCSGLSRVDFFIRRKDGAVLFNEINTIPGFTSISMYPKMFEAAGMSYSELLDRLLTLACEKGAAGGCVQ